MQIMQIIKKNSQHLLAKQALSCYYYSVKKEGYITRKGCIKWILYIEPIEVLASYGFNFIHDRVETLSIDPKNLEKIQHDRLNEKSNVAAEKI